MRIRAWVFVTAPFILFTAYTFLAASAYPGSPRTMRVLAAAFLVGILALMVAQRISGDDNYFVPTIVLVVAAHFGLVFAIDPVRFADLAQTGNPASLLLERPQLILYFALMLMALLPPLLRGTSFTSYFARVDYPEEVWSTREFLVVNRYLSYFWFAVFLLCFLSQFAPVLAVQLVAPIAIVLTLGAPGTRKLSAFLIERVAGED